MVGRITGHSNPYQNLVNSKDDEFWISGDPKDFKQAVIELRLADFYHVS